MELFQKLAHMSRKTYRIFMKILSKMVSLDTEVPLNIGIIRVHGPDPSGLRRGRGLRSSDAFVFFK